MKKIGFILPVLLFVLFSVFGTRMFASGAVSPITLVIAMVVILGLSMVFRPKTKAPKPVSEVENMVRGDFAKDAFLNDPQKNAKFQAALKDYSGNMPKAAYAKLTKLAPLCQTDEETYAVAIATATVQIRLQKYPEAIRQFNKALLIHPTPEVAIIAGSCHQRMGQLRKARDSYEFALDLVPNYIEAFSAIATTWVADRKYETAIDFAEEALELDENHASALATMAICQGLLGNRDLSDEYTDKAVNNGYSRKKIEDTIKALRK